LNKPTRDTSPNKKRKKNKKDHRRAKSLLRLYGIEYPDVGAKANPPVHPTTVSVVLGGHRTSANIIKTITRMLRAHDPELTESFIWEEQNNKAA